MSTKEYMKEWREKNKQKVIDYNKQYRETHKDFIKELKKDHKYDINNEKARESRKKWNENNKEKIKAHKRLETAVCNGSLKRLPCEVCGDIKSQAHHPDYSKPLEVIWLCQLHHKQLHAKLLQESSAIISHT